MSPIFRSSMPGAFGYTGALRTGPLRTGTGLPADNHGKDEPDNGETQEGNDDFIEKLPFDDPLQRWDESCHAAECEQTDDELVLPVLHNIDLLRTKCCCS